MSPWGLQAAFWAPWREGRGPDGLLIPVRPRVVRLLKACDLLCDCLPEFDGSAQGVREIDVRNNFCLPADVDLAHFKDDPYFNHVCHRFR